MPFPLHAHAALASTLFDRAFWEGQTSLAVLAQVGKIVLLYLLLRFALRKIVSKIVLPIIARGGESVDAESAARLKTLAGLLNSIIGYTLAFVFGIMLLRAFHLDPVPLLTTASVAGLAVGFGAQKLVKDVISGFFILLENQYAVGDYLTVNGVTGTVEQVGMRTTQIRDDAGRLYTLANGDIAQVCNQSRGTVAAFLDIGIAPAADVSRATQIINEAGQDIAKSQPNLGFDAPPVVQGLGAMDGARLTLRVSCPVNTPAKLTAAQDALRAFVRQKLTDAQIPLA